MGVKAFFSSLWVSLLNSLRTPLPTSAPALEMQRLMNSTPSTMQGINTVNRTSWTADAASAYGIQKNKVEIENYTGEIVLNKEK